jgi:hypothetical protein
VDREIDTIFLKGVFEGFHEYADAKLPEIRRTVGVAPARNLDQFESNTAVGLSERVYQHPGLAQCKRAAPGADANRCAGSCGHVAVDIVTLSVGRHRGLPMP